MMSKPPLLCEKLTLQTSHRAWHERYSSFTGSIYALTFSEMTFSFSRARLKMVGALVVLFPCSQPPLFFFLIVTSDFWQQCVTHYHIYWDAFLQRVSSAGSVICSFSSEYQLFLARLWKPTQSTLCCWQFRSVPSPGGDKQRWCSCVSKLEPRATAPTTTLEVQDYCLKLWLSCSSSSSDTIIFVQLPLFSIGFRRCVWLLTGIPVFWHKHLFFWCCKVLMSGRTLQVFFSTAISSYLSSVITSCHGKRCVDKIALNNHCSAIVFLHFVVKYIFFLSG